MEVDADYAFYAGWPEIHVRWRLADAISFTAWSPDFTRHQNGFVSTAIRDRERQ